MPRITTDNTMTTFAFRSRTRIGTWNVRTLLPNGRLDVVLNEMNRYNIKVMGLSETRWHDAGEHICPSGESFLYSGRNPTESHRDGVGMILTKEARSSLISWSPVSERIITARLHTRLRNTTIVQCYAPTEDADDDIKDEFYTRLNEVFRSIPRGDIIVLMGDLNAQIGPNNTGLEHIIGNQGMSQVTNNNGELFVDFCSSHQLTVGGTYFCHKKIHKETWVSPDGRTRNQIDHVAVSRRWRTIVEDVRSFRGADTGSDHHLVIATIRLKIATTRNVQHNAINRRRFNVDLLRDSTKRLVYIEKFQQNLNQRSVSDETNLEGMWSATKGALLTAAQDSIGYVQRSRQQWISDATWQKIERRRALKNSVNSTGDPERRRQIEQEYSQLHREVKRCVRRDKRRQINELAEKAENAANTGNSKVLYQITKQLSGKHSTKKHAVKSADGRLLCNDEEQLQRWREHFLSVLNGSFIQEPERNMDNAQPIRINTRIPSKTEIITAIHAMANGKAAGKDGIPPELLKADSSLTADALHPILEIAWNTCTFPEDWTEGIIVKIPKKGDLTICDNWRGICLLSTVGKVLSHIILSRIKEAVDRTIRRQQAGFRKGRSCIDHINTLRIIVEQSTELRSPLYLAFVDYEKAFDSINRGFIWQALRQRGLPEKIIELIKALYSNSKCRVLHNGKLSDSFEVSSGVRQGCLLSPLLFLIVINDILVSALDRRSGGIQWGLLDRLKDLDYADDICLLAHRHQDLNNMIQNLATESSSIGLRLNPTKTKEMRINTSTTSRTALDSQDVELVDKFCYLGSVITEDGGAEEDVSSRINKARGAYSQLFRIWKSTEISVKTKLRLFNSNVKAVLLYGCETWKVTQSITRRLQVFINRCLRHILKIRWQDRIRNEEVWRRAGQERIDDEIRRRKWNWIGHTLRRDNDNIAKQALDWNPQGTRRVGRPKATWRRTMLAEAAATGRSWTELKAVAQNRVRWRATVSALCPTRD